MKIEKPKARLIKEGTRYPKDEPPEMPDFESYRELDNTKGLGKAALITFLITLVLVVFLAAQ